MKMSGNGQIVWSVGFAKDGNSIAWGNTFADRNIFAYGPPEKSFILYDRSGGMAPGQALSDDNSYIRAIERKGTYP